MASKQTFTTNPWAPQNNLHHTRTYWSDEELWREQQRDKAEAAYFAHIEAMGLVTHSYPLSTTSGILVGNGFDTFAKELPF